MGCVTRQTLQVSKYLKAHLTEPLNDLATVIFLQTPHPRTIVQIDVESCETAAEAVIKYPP